MNYKIYHNSKCSKSRIALQLLKEHDISPEVINYLETPITRSEIEKLLNALNLTPRDIIRTGEAEYKDNNLNDESISDAKLIDYIVKFPKLLERPIIVKGKHAVIGRPPENVLKLI